MAGHAQTLLLGPGSTTFCFHCCKDGDLLRGQERDNEGGLLHESKWTKPWLERMDWSCPRQGEVVPQGHAWQRAEEAGCAPRPTLPLCPVTMGRFPSFFACDLGQCCFSLPPLQMVKGGYHKEVGAPTPIKSVSLRVGAHASVVLSHPLVGGVLFVAQPGVENQ